MQIELHLLVYELDEATEKTWQVLEHAVVIIINVRLSAFLPPPPFNVMLTFTIWKRSSSSGNVKRHKSSVVCVCVCSFWHRAPNALVIYLYNL